jgi:hypothetical protein
MHVGLINLLVDGKASFFVGMSTCRLIVLLLERLRYPGSGLRVRVIYPYP